MRARPDRQSPEKITYSSGGSFILFGTVSKDGCMDASKKRTKIPKPLKFLAGYLSGSIFWISGFHCLEVKPSGDVSLSSSRWTRHLLKLFLWTLAFSFVLDLLGLYRAWILNAAVPEIVMAVLVKSIIFIYIKVFWPRVFPTVLPGMRLFFCPQCYQEQTFLFMPVSLQLGFGVTYLCRYCSCLVNGWGEQIFYPLNVRVGRILSLVPKILPPALLACGAGFWFCRTLWNFLKLY